MARQEGRQGALPFETVQAKRVREDESRVYYSVVVPGFSLWAISGSAEAPEVRFRVDDLSIQPDRLREGDEVTITAQVTNLTDEPAEFVGTLWLNA